MYRLREIEWRLDHSAFRRGWPPSCAEQQLRALHLQLAKYHPVLNNFPKEGFTTQLRN